MLNRVREIAGWLGQPHTLERATLVYIVLPIPIFVLGWIRPLVAIPALAIIFVGTWLAMRPEADPPANPVPASDARPDHSWKSAAGAAVIVLALFVVLYSGVGGYATPQEHAYHRHNAFLQDLIQYSWPVAYSETGPRHEPGILVFYIGNALTPALLGKAFGWGMANHASFLLAAASLLLALWWFVRIVGAAPVYGLIFLFFGGLDLAGWVATLGWYQSGIPNLDFWAREYTLKHWALGGVYWMYASNVYMLYHAPQHVVCSWLATLVILYDAIRAGNCGRAVFIWSCSLLWSAFSFAGMLPIVALAVLTTRGRGLFSFANVAAGATILLLTGLYISSNSQDYVHGWYWEFHDPLRSWPLLVLVLAVEFGVYALALPLRSVLRSVNPAWWWTVLACLLVAPLYRLGKNNDLTTKGVIPALVVFQVFLAMGIARARSESGRRAARVLIALLAAGALTAVSNVTGHLAGDLGITPPAIRTVAHVDEIRPRKLAAQLFGSGDAFFWKALGREPEYQLPDRRPGRRPFTGPRATRPTKRRPRRERPTP
jgi:hypothetical protein